MTQSNIKQILDMLDTLQEQLLSLPDDMWLNIDPRDNESIDQGTAFIKAYNQNLKQFSESARNIAVQVKEHFGINPEEEELVQESSNRLQRERIIKELDRSTPHSLNQDFTYKRPYGFVLADNAFKGLKTWKSMYIHILSILERKDAQMFSGLTSEEKFISKRGNPLFSQTAESLRVAEKYMDDFFVEVNLSANMIRNNIKELLQHFNLEPSGMKVYLREDRDAQ
jgi:EAL domain-containing protein (putative c-di-GMP-specific phosphodiesterase class I)